MQGQGFENIGEKTHLYYGSWDPRPGGEGADESFPPRGGLGLATLERDRFATLSPRKAAIPADLITSEVPLTVKGIQEISINASGLGEESSLRVEILDGQEHPLEHFAGSNAAIIREDGFRSPAQFATEPSTDALPSTIRLKVSFEGKEAHQIKLSAIYI